MRRLLLPMRLTLRAPAFSRSMRLVRGRGVMARVSTSVSKPRSDWTELSCSNYQARSRSSFAGVVAGGGTASSWS
jgi:hypothetical protein